MNDLYVLNELESADFDILMTTDVNLSKFDFRFTEQVYELITNEGETVASEKVAQVREVEQIIRNNAEWMKVIRDKAAKRNITVDEMIHLDAVWMVEKKQNEK